VNKRTRAEPRPRSRHMNGGTPMRKLIMLTTLAGLTAAIALTALPAAAKAPGENGQIAFARFDATLGDTVVYTINPDGTHQQQLFSPTVTAEGPHWSPDGTRIVDSCCGLAAFIINPDTGSTVSLPMTDPDLFYGCNVWSPDGTQLACEAGFIDPSLQGIYTIRSPDGGALTQITSNPGGDDSPASYSPDGKRLAFTRQSVDGSLTLDTVKLDGTGLRQLTPTGMDIQFGTGAWSPQGNDIVFSAQASDSVAGSIWVVHADGSGLHQLAIAGCGGPFSDPNFNYCLDPTWSPDGQKIAFSLFSAATRQREIYTVKTDGTGLFQVTHGVSTVPGEGAEAPNWGTHPPVR
jgi:Tol biopolymer transport system component